MKKRLLLILALGISFAPLAFADETKDVDANATYCTAMDGPSKGASAVYDQAPSGTLDQPVVSSAR